MTAAEHKFSECLAYGIIIGIAVFVIGLILYGITEIENIYWWFLALAPILKIFVTAIICGFVTFVMGMIFVEEMPMEET
ncbi:MAG: hypothetical protein KAJ03_07355 [Gammaproteobacteria bacterium]|nr:hypothetical protein [Gammaproteobacteria bacterium]